MVSVVTGGTQQEESSAKTHTFDMVKWIRVRRLQWLGHNADRLVKQAVFEMWKKPKESDFLMDTPEVRSWCELGQLACDRD